MRDDDLPETPLVLADRVDDAVVGDPRDEQVSEIGKRRLVVERGGEERARLGQEADPSLGTPLLGDVVEDGDHEVHLARFVQQGCRANHRPAFVAARKDAIAKGGLLRRALREGEPVRELVDRHRCAVLTDDLEPLQQLRAREAEQLLARLQAAQARGGVVRIDESSVRGLGGDPVADNAQDRRQLLGRQRNLVRPCRADLRLAHSTHWFE